MAIFTKEKTNKALSEFNKKCRLVFYDSSYGNDCTDSLEHEFTEDKFLKVFIPNSDEDDSSRELFNTYTVMFAGEGEVLFESKELDKVITFINEDFNV